MTFEANLKTVLAVVTPRVFPDFAPVSTTRPYVTYQQVGGEVLNLLQNVPSGVKYAEMQINVWSDTRAEAVQIANAIEDAMRAATTFFAKPTSAFIADYDADVPVYGTHQDFSCRWTTA